MQNINSITISGWYFLKSTNISTTKYVVPYILNTFDGVYSQTEHLFAGGMFNWKWSNAFKYPFDASEVYFYSNQYNSALYGNIWFWMAQSILIDSTGKAGFYN